MTAFKDLPGTVTFRSVSSDRQRWEDQVNASFVRVGSSERVCRHADITVYLNGPDTIIECDYCPSSLLVPSYLKVNPEKLPPSYYKL